MNALNTRIRKAFRHELLKLEGNLGPQEIARCLVYVYLEENFGISATYPKFSVNSLYVVHYNRIRQWWMAWLITPFPDNMLYKVTYDNEAQKTFLVAYQESGKDEFYLDFDPEE